MRAAGSAVNAGVLGARAHTALTDRRWQDRRRANHGSRPRSRAHALNDRHERIHDRRVIHGPAAGDDHGDRFGMLERLAVRPVRGQRVVAVDDENPGADGNRFAPQLSG